MTAQVTAVTHDQATVMPQSATPGPLNASPLASSVSNHSFYDRAWRYLTVELAATPGRFEAMLRTLIACVIVTILSMALEVPLLSLSLFVVFMVNQENFVKARVTAIGITFAATVGIGLTILVLRYTMDQTLIRMLLCAAIVYGCAYFMRVSKLGSLFSLVALVVLFGQAAADRIGDGELLVRACLWAWVAVVYPAMVALAINVWVLPARPDQQFRVEVVRQITIVKDFLQHILHNQPQQFFTTQSQALALSMTLLHLQKACALQNKQSQWIGPEGLILISAVDQMIFAMFEQVDLATGQIEMSAVQQETIRQCVAELSNIQDAIKYSKPLKKSHQWDSVALSSVEPEAVRNIVRALKFLFSSQTLQSSAVCLGEEPLFLSDAWNNPFYSNFALKTVFSTYLCYLFYSAVSWPGIHTCMLTCIIVAVPGLGPSVVKGALRIGGCLVGSLLALFAFIFVIPHLDSLTGLLLMIMPIIAASAWITAGSERISYAGLQIMFAFSLAILDHFGPSSDLSELRDRLVGVLLGVTVSTIVNVFFWPDSIREALRKQAKELMEALHALVSDNVPGRSSADIAKQRLQSWQLLDACQRGLDDRLLEPGQKIHNQAMFTMLSQNWLTSATMTVAHISQAQWEGKAMDASIQAQLAGLSEQMNLMTNWPQPNKEQS